jgi:1-acyl-sn-glycerol-3-phosphate acyltransferase
MVTLSKMIGRSPNRLKAPEPLGKDAMPRDLLYRGAVLLGRGLFRALDLQRVILHRERLDRPGGAVLAITHFGYLDFALAEWAVHRQTGRLTRFLITAPVFDHPLAGPLLRTMRHIPVERAAGGPAYGKAVAALRAGEFVGIFPEGQVNVDDVGVLKTGAVRMAVEADVPIIPIVVWGGQRVLTKGQRFSLRRARHRRVIISIGEPMFPGDRPEADVDLNTLHLYTALRAMVQESKLLIER